MRPRSMPNGPAASDRLCSISSRISASRWSQRSTALRWAAVARRRWPAPSGIAAEHAKFGQPEVKLGLLPGGGGTQRLPRLVGKGRALQLILSGGTISAQEAYRIGLVNEVVPTADLDPACGSDPERDRLERTRRCQICARGNQQRNGHQPKSRASPLEASYFGLCAATEDKREGTTAFLEKRAPQFQGR